jgi:uncharacterized OB-fold protein
MGGEKMETFPFKKGLFVEESGNAFLIGTQCKACERVFYPPRPFCFDCFGEEIDEVKLGNRGKLYSYTVCHMPSLHFASPYTVGWIDLKEGIRVFAPIKNGIDERIEIGMEMELVIDDLWEEEGRRFVGYKYRPLQSDI